MIKLFAVASSTFNSSTGRVITHSLGNTNYKVLVQPTANPDGYLGEIYVTKAADTCTVYNSGTATTAFDIFIVKDGVLADISP